jgi:leukotriene-A4 hydrolase
LYLLTRELGVGCSHMDSWLNEGWTMYLERRILAKIHGTDAYFHFSALGGWNALGNTP